MSNEPEFRIFHPDRSGIRQVLGDLEAEIMEVIWARPPGQGVTVRDIFEFLYERRHLAYTTVQSTMNRLAKKRILKSLKEDQAYIYYPILTQPEFISRFVERVLDGLLSNFTGETQKHIMIRPDLQAAERAHRLLEEISHRKNDWEEC